MFVADDVILPLLVAVPLAGAALVLAVAPLGRDYVRRMALTNVLVTFLLSLQVAVNYRVDNTTPASELLQMQSSVTWTGSPVASRPGLTLGPDIRWSFGVDGISLWLILLTTLLMIPSVLVSWEAIAERPAAYYALMLFLEAGMIGVFAATDIILFYIFFEFTLIPLFFMIGLWGGYDRRWAARKFFIFTLAGSLLTFLGLVFIVLSHSWMSGNSQLTFSIPRLLAEVPALAAQPENSKFWAQTAPWIFLALFAGFAVKVPLFPFHTWLPLAHVEAPTAGSVLLAGVLLKVGSYGFVRFMLPLVPEACWWAFDWIAILAVIGIIYGALLALAQDDIKKLVAYSSVSHMGFCLLGLFALNSVGITGGMLQMLNHGLSTGALFAMVGMLYERYHTRDIEAYGGLARKFPVMAFFLGVLVFSSIGLPGLNGFTGEVLALAGMFAANAFYAILALTGIILGAWYMLSLLRQTFFGRFREPVLEGHGHAPAVHTEPAAAPEEGHEHPVAKPHDLGAPIPDLNFRELAALVPICVLIFWIGLWPDFFTRRMEPSVRQIVKVLNANHGPGNPLPRTAERPTPPSPLTNGGSRGVSDPPAVAAAIDPLQLPLGKGESQDTLLPLAKGESKME